MNRRFTLSLFAMSLLGNSFLLGGCTSAPSKDSTTEVSSERAESANPFACAVDDHCDSESEAQEDKLDQALASFTPLDFESAISFFEEGKSGVLYFGFHDCPWCEDVVPLLYDAASQEDVEVYYVETRDLERNRLYTDEQKERIIPYIGDYMSDNEKGELTLYVPLVLSVKDGKVTMAHQGTVEGHQAKEREMTDEENAQVREDLEKIVREQK